MWCRWQWVLISPLLTVVFFADSTVSYVSFVAPADVCLQQSVVDALRIVVAEVGDVTPCALASVSITCNKSQVSKLPFCWYRVIIMTSFDYHYMYKSQYVLKCIPLKPWLHTHRWRLFLLSKRHWALGSQFLMISHPCCSHRYPSPAYPSLEVQGWKVHVDFKLLMDAIGLCGTQGMKLSNYLAGVALEEDQGVWLSRHRQNGIWMFIFADRENIGNFTRILKNMLYMGNLPQSDWNLKK